MEGFVETRDGQRLAYCDSGSGRPIVFIHGWSLSGEIWQPQVDWLVAQGHRAIVYDRRGHGRSDKPATGYDYDTLADDLAAVLELTDATDATLVGHSMGAGEIVRYFARHGSKRIGRTMFVAPITPFALKTPDNPEGTDSESFDQIVAALDADPRGYLTAGAPSLLGEASSPQTVQWALDIAFQADPQALVKCMRAFTETDFRPDMRAVTTPTLVLYGTGDLPSIAGSSRRTAAAIAGSRLDAYEGAPHGLFITDRERFNDDLLRFARS
jgi:pimeloyl-ACP methyl ester carboxylesterase